MDENTKELFYPAENETVPHMENRFLPPAEIRSEIRDFDEDLNAAQHFSYIRDLPIHHLTEQNRRSGTNKELSQQKMRKTLDCEQYSSAKILQLQQRSQASIIADHDYAAIRLTPIGALPSNNTCSLNPDNSGELPNAKSNKRPSFPLPTTFVNVAPDVHVSNVPLSDHRTNQSSNHNDTEYFDCNFKNVNQFPSQYSAYREMQRPEMIQPDYETYRINGHLNDRAPVARYNPYSRGDAEHANARHSMLTRLVEDTIHLQRTNRKYRRQHQSLNALVGKRAVFCAICRMQYFYSDTVLHKYVHWIHTRVDELGFPVGLAEPYFSCKVCGSSTLLTN